jgi:hypothetical protein
LGISSNDQAIIIAIYGGKETARSERCHFNGPGCMQTVSPNEIHKRLRISFARIINMQSCMVTWVHKVMMEAKPRLNMGECRSNDWKLKQFLRMK